MGRGRGSALTSVLPELLRPFLRTQVTDCALQVIRWWRQLAARSASEGLIGRLAQQVGLLKAASISSRLQIGCSEQLGRVSCVRQSITYWAHSCVPRI